LICNLSGLNFLDLANFKNLPNLFFVKNVPIRWSFPDYWTTSKIEPYKVFENLTGLGAKQKCPVVRSGRF
jgi:hypothetical protein